MRLCCSASSSDHRASSHPVTRGCPQCGAACLVEHMYCPTCGFPVGHGQAHNEDKFIGRTLPGGYHILDLISVGGMGRVYRAEQSVLGRTVAVKVIHPHLLSDENSALRFITEARAASQLNHPNSIAVFDFGRTDDGQPYLVMEFLRGKDLARVAYEEGPLSFRRIVDVLRQVLAALSEAHDLGIVHRDLKPENVVFEPLRRGGDFVKVLDFGLAKLKADTQAPSVTSPGIVCGTPDYMAPEQGRGDPIDGRSDLYAVGVILFQLLTGRLPFEAESPTQVVMMHLSIPVPDPRQVAPERNIPQSLVDVVFKAMQKDADKRYQDAIELADALKRALDFTESTPPLSLDRSSGPASVSFVPGKLIACPACQLTVPMAKFCCECGARLPVRSRGPRARSPHPSFRCRWSGATRTWPGSRIGGWKSASAWSAREWSVNPGPARRGSCASSSRAPRTRATSRSWSSPIPYYAEVGYYAVRQAVQKLASLSDEEIELRRFLQANVEAQRGLEEIFDGMPRRDDKRSPVERRYALAEALRWALERAAALAAPNRVILAMDELHRIDPPSRNAFADALGEPPPSGALMLAAHVPGFEAGWSGEQASARILPGLPPPAVQRLLRSARPSERRLGAEGDTGRGLLPMYVEQLLRYSIEGGTDPPARLADLDRAAGRHARARCPPRAAGGGSDRRPGRAGGDRTGAGRAGRPRSGADRAEDSRDDRTCRRAGVAPRIRCCATSCWPAFRSRCAAICIARRCARWRSVRRRSKRAPSTHFTRRTRSRRCLLLEQVADRGAARGDTSTEVLGSAPRSRDRAPGDFARRARRSAARRADLQPQARRRAHARAATLPMPRACCARRSTWPDPAVLDRARVLGALAHVAHGRRALERGDRLHRRSDRNRAQVGRARPGHGIQRYPARLGVLNP